jgi:hypothetical protein
MTSSLHAASRLVFPPEIPQRFSEKARPRVNDAPTAKVSGWSFSSVTAKATFYAACVELAWEWRRSF